MFPPYPQLHYKRADKSFLAFFEDLRGFQNLAGLMLYLAIARKNRHRIDLLDNRNGNILWTENISGFDPVNSPISSPDVSEQGQRTVFAISRDWTKQNKETYLFLFEKSGIMVWKHKLKEPVIQCSISPDGKCLFIFSNREGYLFRM